MRNTDTLYIQQVKGDHMKQRTYNMTRMVDILFNGQ